MENEIGGHTTSELGNALNQVEDSLNNGGKANLQLISTDLPTVDELSQMYDKLVSIGFHVTKPTSKVIDGLSLTELTLTKGSPQWSLLIAVIPAALIVGLIAFSIVRIEAITKALIPLILILGGVVVAVAAAVASSPGAAKVAEAAISRRR